MLGVGCLSVGGKMPGEGGCVGSFDHAAVDGKVRGRPWWSPNGLQLGRGEKKFGRGEASAYAHFTPDELIAYAERIRFTPDELGPGLK